MYRQGARRHDGELRTMAINSFRYFNLPRVQFDWHPFFVENSRFAAYVSSVLDSSEASQVIGTDFQPNTYEIAFISDIWAMFYVTKYADGAIRESIFDVDVCG